MSTDNPIPNDVSNLAGNAKPNEPDEMADKYIALLAENKALSAKLKQIAAERSRYKTECQELTEALRRVNKENELGDAQRPLMTQHVASLMKELDLYQQEIKVPNVSSELQTLQRRVAARAAALARRQPVFTAAVSEGDVSELPESARLTARSNDGVSYGQSPREELMQQKTRELAVAYRMLEEHQNQIKRLNSQLALMKVQLEQTSEEWQKDRQRLHGLELASNSNNSPFGKQTSSSGTNLCSNCGGTLVGSPLSGHSMTLHETPSRLHSTGFYTRASSVASAHSFVSDGPSSPTVLRIDSAPMDELIKLFREIQQTTLRVLHPAHPDLQQVELVQLSTFLLKSIRERLQHQITLLQSLKPSVDSPDFPEIESWNFAAHVLMDSVSCRLSLNLLAETFVHKPSFSRSYTRNRDDRVTNDARTGSSRGKNAEKPLEDDSDWDDDDVILDDRAPG